MRDTTYGLTIWTSIYDKKPEPKLWTEPDPNLVEFHFEEEGRTRYPVPESCFTGYAPEELRDAWVKSYEKFIALSEEMKTYTDPPIQHHRYIHGQHRKKMEAEGQVRSTMFCNWQVSCWPGSFGNHNVPFEIIETHRDGKNMALRGDISSDGCLTFSLYGPVKYAVQSFNFEQELIGSLLWVRDNAKELMLSSNIPPDF